MAELVRIGRIAGAFGLKGQVKVDPMTDFLDRFAKGSRLRLNDDWVEVEAFAIHKGRPLLKLSGIDSIDQAEKLQWQYLEAVPAEVELDEDEFLTEDLIGMEVVTVDGRSLGKVSDVHAYPAQDIIEVSGIMIPAVKQFVKSVEVQDRRITVELIDGMLPE